jgi:hypothetical protein
MAKRLEMDLTPTTPPPSATTPTRALAKRYMSDAVRLLAGIAFAPDSEAGLHTKMLACKQLIEVAGITPPTPVAPGTGNDA